MPNGQELVLRAIEVIERRRAEGRPGLEAYWAAVPEGRQRFATALESASPGQFRVIAIVVGNGFQNPNAVIDDFVAVVTSCRSRVEAVNASLVFVLVSRGPLDVPNVGSPVPFPDWFPGLGGLVCDVRIVDLFRQIRVSFRAREAALDELHEAVYEWDKALACLLARCSSPQRREALRLLRGGHGADDGLGAAQACLASVSDPTAYRILLGGGRTPAAWCVHLFSKTAPTALPGLAQDLAIHLGVGEQANGSESVAAVLARSPKDFSAGAWHVHDALIVISQAYRFLNAEAHADEFPTFHPDLLRLASLDLRVFLRSSANALNLTALSGA